MRTIIRAVVAGIGCAPSISTTIVSVVLSVSVLPALSTTAIADTFTVCLPAAGTCDYTAPEDAVNDPGIIDGDIIDILTETYVLAGPLQIGNNITINGNGSTLDANNDRGVEVSGATTDAVINNLTIRNGRDPGESSGGAIRVDDGATLTLNGLIIADNSANSRGGGLYNFGSTVRIYDSEFLRNTAGFSGGAIHTRGSAAVTDLTRVTIDGNTASVIGGGLSVDSGGEFNVIASTISRNGALGETEDVSTYPHSLTSSWCEGGPFGQTFIAGAEGLRAFEFSVRLNGGLDPIPADLVVPGAVRLGENGAIIALASTIIPGGLPGSSIITLHFTLDHPVALIPDDTYSIELTRTGLFGVLESSSPYPDGQSYNCSGTLASGDYAFRTLGGTPGDGGGVYATGLIDVSNRSSIGLYNTTVSGNVGDGGTAENGATLSTLFGTVTNNSGNGLTAVPDEVSGGLVFFTASIIAGNGDNDCDGSSSILTSSGFNLIGDGTGCPFTPEPGDQVGDTLEPIDPLLGPLQNNGGSTETHAIDQTSPAFDSAGDILETHCSASPEDQRGINRPTGSECDIGAYEYVGPLQMMIDLAIPGATIDVPDGTYTEQISLGDNKTLRGSAPGSVIINADGLGGSAITATGDFTLENINVTGGSTSGNGGGINSDVAGNDITLIRVLFENNDAVIDGGAIYLRSGNSATISDSTFSDNTAGNTGGAIATTGPLISSYTRYEDNLADDGGAIGIYGESINTVTSNNDLFTGNMANYSGGAIFNPNSNLFVTDGTFLTNTAGQGGFDSAGQGGAIYNDRSAEITETIFSDNRAIEGNIEGYEPGLGGAIYNRDALTLTDSSINTSSAGIGGGLYNTSGSIVTISGTTMRDNNADGSGTVGGAIGGAGTIEITNSTLSGNTAIDGESGRIGNGGGIGLWAGTARLNNVTLAYNSSTGMGGPLHGSAGALIFFSNSLLSDNTDTGSNCAAVLSLGFNLFQTTPCPTVAGDIISEPLIGLLASNGGPTQTHALLGGSPAIDAGNPVPGFPSFHAGNFPLLQTQGYARPDAGHLLLAEGIFNVGSAFLADPIDPTLDFAAQFEFLIVPDAGGAADGLTFTISDDPTVLGAAGGFLGLGYNDPIESVIISVVNGVSVEFDTWVNGSGVGANDGTAEDHIGINLNGSLSSAPLVKFGSHGVFSDGNVWTVWIDYEAGTNTLEVRAANNAVRPAAATISTTVDIASLTGPNAYVGFTGATGSGGISGEQRIVSFSFGAPCEETDQRGEPRPNGTACDIGAFEGAPIPLELESVTLRATLQGEELDDGMSYPGVVDVPIIDIPIEKLTGDTFNAPESAPLGSFPLGSFPIGSFDLQSSPLGSFPLGSFPLGSFPLGSFPLSSIPLLTVGGWNEILNEYSELAGAPPQTITLEELMALSSPGDSVASIELRDLSIQDSPLASLSLPGLSLGATTVAELNQWATNAGETSSVCDALHAEDPTLACGDLDTLLSLESKGAPVSALSLSSLPLGSFPIGSFPLGSFPIGSFPLGSFPLGSFPLGSFPLGSFPLGSFPIGSFPLGSFNLLAAPIGSFPLGSFPIGSFPLGSFEINGKSFCEFYEEVGETGDKTCAQLGIDPNTDSLTELVAALDTDNPASTIASSPLGSFPIGSFPIGSFPIGSFDMDALSMPPISELTLGDFNGCTLIADNSTDTCSTLILDDNSTLWDVAHAYGDSLAASPLGSFPIGSFDVAGLPLGSFPLGSFDVNGAPLGSFPLGSFDLISSTLGSFPIGSFPLGSFPPEIVTDPSGLCSACQTLADAAKAGVINTSATLEDLRLSTEFANTTLGVVLDAMTLATLYCPPDPDPTTSPLVECAETLGDIKDPGNLTLGQILIAMMLKTDFPWETIPLDQLSAQEFSADNFIDFEVDFELTGTESEEVWVQVSMDENFLFAEGSATLDVITATGAEPTVALSDPEFFNFDGTQTLTFKLFLGGYTDNVVRFTMIPPLALGDYPASAEIIFVDDIIEGSSAAADYFVAATGSTSSRKSKVSASRRSPRVAAAEVVGSSDGLVTVIPDPITNASQSSQALTASTDALLLGFIDSPSDNDYYKVAPPAAGDRVSVFMSNPAGDNDLIMYEPLSTVEAKGQQNQAPPLDSVPFEDDGVDYQGNLTEEPNALEDVNLAAAPLASISTNRGTIDESVSAIAGNDEPFIIQVSGYNGATSVQPYTLRFRVIPEVQAPQCSARTWPNTASATVLPAGNWTADTNAVFLVNGSRLASSDPGGPTAADDALTAINSLVGAPGIVDGVVVDVSTIFGVDYAAWDLNPCSVKAPNSIVNAITQYLEEMRVHSPDLSYVTIVGSDEVIPFARKPDETSIANESTFAGEFEDNAMYGALVTRHFLSDDTFGDIDPIPWLDRFLNVSELGVGRLVESASDIQTAAENYIASAGILDPATALSAGYDFIADASQQIDDTFRDYAPLLGFGVEPALIDQPEVDPLAAWTRTDFLNATGVNTPNPVDQVSFNMHFDFDEALPSIGDATGNPSAELIHVSDLDGADLSGGIWFTVGCHSGSSVADVSVVGAPSQDWAQTFSRAGALYLAQNAYGLGDTEAVALTERLMSNFAGNLNGSLTIGQAHAFAKQQYFADLGLYGEYDFKAMQAATLFGLPMYQYGLGTTVVEPPPPPLPVAPDPISGLSSAGWSLSNTGIQKSNTSKGDLFSVDGEVQFVHFRPLQPIVRRDVTGPNGEVAGGAFLTRLTTEDKLVTDMAFARPVIDLGENETEIESDEVVFPTAFTNIATFNAPPPAGGPFAPRQQLNVIVGQFTSPPDGGSSGTERLFRSFDAQVFYRQAPTSAPGLAPAGAAAGAGLAPEDDFLRPELDNVQATLVGPSGAQQAAFSVDAFDEGTVLRVVVLYLQSVSGTPERGNWVLVDLVRGGEPDSHTWTGGGPVDLSGIADGQIDYMVQAVDANGNVANSTFKGLFYVAEELPPPPDPGGGSGSIGVVVTVEGDEVDPGDWIDNESVDIEVTDQDPEVSYEYSVDFAPFQLLTSAGFQIIGDGVHTVTVQESDGSNPVTFVILIDTTPPQAVINTPSEDEFVVQGQEPAADFDCLDAGSGIASCVGTVANGSPVPAPTPGSHTFIVTAQDDAELGPTVAEHMYFVVKPLEVGGPTGPGAIAEPVTVTASATDLSEFEEMITIDWGDGGPTEFVDLSVGSVSSVSSDHVYPFPGIFQVTVTVDYEGQFTQVGTVDFVTVYDPDGASVSGKGKIDSPAGAFTPNDSSDADVTGKVEFDFKLAYKFKRPKKSNGKGLVDEGQWVLDGNTRFHFHAAGLKFDTRVNDWMVIAGAHARYQGEAKLSGPVKGLVKFQVTVLDANISGAGVDEDSFRIRIWQEEASGTVTVLYDNGMGAADSVGSSGTTPLADGKIEIKTPKKK